MIPAWVVTLAVALGKAVSDLLGAQDDAARADALMAASEAVKKAADDAKFGPT